MNAAVSSFLSSLPNRGIFSNVQPGAVFRSPSRPSLADQFADPPPGQRLSKLSTLDTLAELFMSREPNGRAGAGSTKRIDPGLLYGSAPAASGRKRALKVPASEGRAEKKAASSASTSQAPGASSTGPRDSEPPGSGDGGGPNAPAPAPPASQRGQQAPASAGKGSPRTTKTDATGTGRGAAASRTAAPPAVPEPSEARFSRLELQTKTLRELQGVARAWKLTSGGKKEDLITRLLDHQRTRKA